MPAQLAYQVWIGVEDSLIREVAGDFGVASMEMLYTDWGSEVQVTAPPADQILQTDL